MMERDKYILWDAGEVIYRAGDPSNEAFLIMDGSVQVFTSEGLLLNRIGVNEILGETSLLLDTTRTVTAIASSVGAKATRIPRQYFADLSARDRVAAALIRKSQHRLIDSNKQSNMLGLEIDKIGDLVEQVIGKQDGDTETVAELRKTLADIRKQVVFDRHLAHYASPRHGELPWPPSGCRAMMERDKYILWDAGEVIYRAGDPSNEAFLINFGEFSCHRQ